MTPANPIVLNEIVIDPELSTCPEPIICPAIIPQNTSLRQDITTAAMDTSSVTVTEASETELTAMELLARAGVGIPEVTVDETSDVSVFETAYVEEQRAYHEDPDMTCTCM